MMTRSVTPSIPVPDSQAAHSERQGHSQDYDTDTVLSMAIGKEDVFTVITAKRLGEGEDSHCHGRQWGTSKDEDYLQLLHQSSVSRGDKEESEGEEASGEVAGVETMEVEDDLGIFRILGNENSCIFELTMHIVMYLKWMRPVLYFLTAVKFTLHHLLFYETIHTSLFTKESILPKSHATRWFYLSLACPTVKM